MSNLLKDASILLTPTGYDNGRMNAIKPYKDLYGPELVTNGDFSNGSTGWTISGSASVGVNKLNVNAGAFDFFAIQTTLTNGLKYKVTLDAEVTSGDILLYTGAQFGTISSSGSYTFYTTSDSTQIRFRSGGSGFVGSITNVSVVEDLSGDFTFSRNSAATRVNAQGLVENVQILSSELVSNGDFSQEGTEEVLNGNFSQEGSELITNGDFATDSDWTKGTGWSIGSGKANCDGTQTGNTNLNNSSDNGIVNNKFYKIVYTISNYVSGSIRIKAGNTGFGIYHSSNGTYTQYIKAQVTTFPYAQFNADANFVGSIDNVSVKEVGQNWTFGTGWSIEDGKVVGNSVSAQFLTQSFTFVSGKKYRATCTVTGTDTLNNNNSFRLPYDGGVSNIAYVTKGVDGVYTHEFVSTGGSTLYVGYIDSGSFTGSIDNISVIEITDDTDLPRINYTNGEGSILLEPQSTNLITYSEDFSRWGKNGLTLTSNDLISPEGILNASKLQATQVSGVHLISVFASSSNVKTYSVFAKQNGYKRFRFNTGSSSNGFTSFNLNTGSVVSTGGTFFSSSNIEDYGNGWYKCSMTLLANAPNNYTLAIEDDDGQVNFLGDGISGIYIWGTQVEELSYATSYIPTNGSTVTRLADVCNNAGSSN
jgi:hypothetical protein